MPIIVGGTGLYIKSAINGISKIPKVDKEVLDHCLKLFEKIGIIEIISKTIIYFLSVHTYFKCFLILFFL